MRRKQTCSGLIQKLVSEWTRGRPPSRVLCTDDGHVRRRHCSRAPVRTCVLNDLTRIHFDSSNNFDDCCSWHLADKDVHDGWRSVAHDDKYCWSCLLVDPDGQCSSTVRMDCSMPWNRRALTYSVSTGMGVACLIKTRSVSTWVDGSRRRRKVLTRRRRNWRESIQ